MRARIMILCVVAIAACSRASSSLPAADLAQSLRLAALPNTLHVDPLLDFDGGGRGGNQTETIVGQGGAGGLVGDPKVVLYGVTTVGGDLKCNPYARPEIRHRNAQSGCGVVFEITPQQGGSYKENVLYKFNGANGKVPSGGLLKRPDGSIYGATLGGGAYGEGLVFKLTPSGSGFTASTIYSFNGHNDGSAPQAPLISDDGGALYGTSQGAGRGTVFKLTPSSDGYLKTTLHTFKGKTDGSGPNGGLLRDSNGTLYGTTAGGGGETCGYYGAGCGTVFELIPTSSGYAERVLHVFGKSSHDGYEPEGALIADGKGDLFGTTIFGGSDGCIEPPPDYSSGCGTIYELVRNGSDYTEKIVHAFTEASAGQGLWPQTPLTAGSDGYLYGTTEAGGNFKCSTSSTYSFPGPGCGAVYALAPSHSPLHGLYQFRGGKDGSQPSAPLLYYGGVLYGETLSGGTKGRGTAFKLRL